MFNFRKKLNDEELEHYKFSIICRLSDEKYRDVIDICDEVLGFNPNNEIFLHDKFMACIKLDKFEEAKESLNKIRKINPNNSLVLKYDELVSILNTSMRQNVRNEKYKEYSDLRKQVEQMPKYSTWKKEVFAKYGQKCEVCGSTDQVEIHHRQSFYSIIMRNKITNVMQAFECNGLWDVNNGSVVCKEHHDQTASSMYRQQKLA